MNEMKRRAIVWDKIERMAFRPSSNNDCRKWLGVYARTLHKLWGIGSMWNRFTLDDKFSVTFLNLKCRYYIESVDKYEVSLMNASSDCLHWKTHVDPGFHSKGSLQTCIDKYPHKQIDELRCDIEAVLDGMLFHPRCHTHPEDLGIRHVQLDENSGGLSSHEVRVGGGIENPYVFLFHLRYQFCLVADQVRQTERQRLIDLFERSIKENLKNRKNHKNVNARDLCDY